MLGTYPISSPKWIQLLKDKMRAAFRARPAKECERIFGALKIPAVQTLTTEEWLHSDHAQVHPLGHLATRHSGDVRVFFFKTNRAVPARPGVGACAGARGPGVRAHARGRAQQLDRAQPRARHPGPAGGRQGHWHGRRGQGLDHQRVARWPQGSAGPAPGILVCGC